jgi:hypothetical protein
LVNDQPDKLAVYSECETALRDVKTTKASDQLWVCREFKQEVIAFFQHKERFESEPMQLFEERKISEENLADAHLRSSPTFHRLVLQIQEMSGDLFEEKGDIYNAGGPAGSWD